MDPHRLHLPSLCLQWSGLALGTLSVFAARTEFAAGIWADSESVVIAVFFAIALTLTGLALYAIASPAVLRVMCHPLILLLTAMGLWSLASASNADFPNLALMGAPQTGQGTIWFFGFAGFAASAMILRKHSLAFRSLIILTAGVVLISSLQNMGNIPWMVERLPSLIPPSALFGFNEYQAYFSLGLLPLAAIAFQKCRRRLAASVFFCASLSLLLSGNRLALIAFSVVTIAVLIALMTPWGRRNHTRFEAHPYYLHIIFFILIIASFFPILLVRLVDFQGWAFSLWSRQILESALDPSLFDTLSAAIFGHGWGHYSEYLLRNIPATGVSIYNTGWADISRDEFHSHNGPIESLFAMGLPGLLMTIALPVFIVLFSQNRWRLIAIGFAFGWTALDGFWFMMPSTLATVALGMGAMAETSTHVRLTKFRDGKTDARVAVFLLSSSIAILAVHTATNLRIYSNSMDRFIACLKSEYETSACTSLNIPQDPRGAELNLAKFFEVETSNIMAAHQTGTLTVANRNAYTRFFNLAMDRSATSRSASLAMTLNSAIGAAVFTANGNTILPQAFNTEVEWPLIIRRTLEIAPLRLDILTVYFNWLLLQKNEKDMQTMLAFAQSIDAEHPVVKWYTGFNYLSVVDSATRAQGIPLMRAALDTGLERFMPVNAKTKAALGMGN